VHVGVEDAFSPTRKAHPALRVTENALDALAARLAEAGFPPASADDVPGVRRSTSTTPEVTQD
jgi:hypothetical protein